MRNHGVEFYPGLVQKWGHVQCLKNCIANWYRYRGRVNRSRDLAIREIEREVVDAELVRLALSNFTDVFDHIPPHKQKALLRLVLHKAILTEDTVKIALYGCPPEIGTVMKPMGARCQMEEWLPGQDLNLQPSG